MNLFESIKKWYSYQEYVAFTEALVAQGKTTGPDQGESMILYTRLNLQRMRRWEKTFHVDEALADEVKYTIPQTWWVITEPWCGDSAQIITQLVRIAACSDHIGVRIILRDENLPIMDRYLTGNSRGIPRLIALDEAGRELFTWGPRPEPAQQLVMDWKKHPGDKTYDELKLELHLWYNKDKGQAVQKEIMEKLQSVKEKNHLIKIPG